MHFKIKEEGWGRIPWRRASRRDLGPRRAGGGDRRSCLERERERVGKKQRMRGRRKGAVTAEMVYEEGH
jgi:hypothetical protein